MKNAVKYPILFILLFFSLSALTRNQDDEGHWVRCTGEAVVQNITIEQAQALAKRRARLDAIEKVCGIKLQAETIVKDFITRGDFIHSISYGSVIGEKEIIWETEIIPQDDPSSPPVILQKVQMMALVVRVNSRPDPSFRLEVELNRTVFQSGDEAVFFIEATKDCYITILNIAADDSVYILYPNMFQAENFLKAHTKTEIPTPPFRGNGFGQYRITVRNLRGHTEDTETIKVIATKQKLLFMNELESRGSYRFMGTPRTAVTRLAQWLSDIPLSERSEATVMYTVHAR